MNVADFYRLTADELDEMYEVAGEVLKKMEEAKKKVGDVAITEFSTMKDAVSGLISGSDSVVESLGTIGISAGIAGAKMYAALGPAGLAFAAVTGIIAALHGIDEARIEAFNQTELGQFGQALDEVCERISVQSAEIRENLSGMDAHIETAGVAESNRAKDLARAYEELAGKASLTAEEQQKMKNISGQLVDLVPGLSDYIDEQTGRLNTQKETLDLLIENMELYAKRQAMQDMLTDAYKDRYVAEENVNEAKERIKNVQETFAKEHSDWSDEAIALVLKGDVDGLDKMVREIGSADNYDPKKFQEVFGSTAYGAIEAGEMIDDLEAALGDAYPRLAEAEAVLDEVDAKIESLNDNIAENSNQLQDSTSDIEDTTKQTVEYKQALSDLKAEFSNMDLNISDQLAENLAFLDEGTLESVTQMFEKLKEQTALSTEELQQLFSAIAPGISEQFMASLAEQSPEMQLQISMTLADITAGAEVPIENLQEIFRMLGVDLPNEVIGTFQEQEPFMQISAMNLLTKLGEGQQLVAENLQEVFSAMGIQLPAGLITSLSESEAGVQQQAVSLLSQLKYASDEEREGLIEKLNTLGIDSASLGFIDGIASEEDNANTEGKNLVNASTLGIRLQMASGMLLAKLYGGNFGQGYAEGIKAQAENVAGASAILVRAGAAAIKSAQNSNSPSKLTRSLGIDFSEGYELGISDNEEDVVETVEDWMTRLRNQVTAFAQTPVEVEIARPEFPSVDYSAAASGISGNTFMVPIKAELELGMEPYMREVSRQNALLEEQNRLLKDIREKPVIHDSDVFSSYQRSQQNYFARTGRVGISGID